MKKLTDVQIEVIRRINQLEDGTTITDLLNDDYLEVLSSDEIVEAVETCPLIGVIDDVIVFCPNQRWLDLAAGGELITLPERTRP